MWFVISIRNVVTKSPALGHDLIKLLLFLMFSRAGFKVRLPLLLMDMAKYNFRYILLKFTM